MNKSPTMMCVCVGGGGGGGGGEKVERCRQVTITELNMQNM